VVALKLRIREAELRERARRSAASTKLFRDPAVQQVRKSDHQNNWCVM
jgi:hypothetical protein